MTATEYKAIRESNGTPAPADPGNLEKYENMKITHAYINAQMDSDSWGYSGPPKNAGRILEILSNVGAEFGLTESTETIGYSENGNVIHPTGSTAQCRNFYGTEIELENGDELTDQDQIDWFSCWCEHPSSRDFERHLRKLLASSSTK